jgi:aminomethyltransferase
VTSAKKTCLHQWHQEHGAHLAEFGGYEMPLWYGAGTRAEHLAVVTAAGIFDTSHMAAVSVTGPAARGLLQSCFSKDLAVYRKTGLTDGGCAYGVFLHEDGTVLDDAIVSQLTPEYYLVVVNAGMGAAVAAHLVEHASGMAVVVVDHSDRLGKLDLQGPAAARILARVLRDPVQALAGLGYFSFRGGLPELASGEVVARVALRDGTPLLLSRTGYTGEQGFEIFVAVEQLPALWVQLLAVGDAEGLLPCGLAARDSLRAGAGLPLSHQDIGNWPFLHNPWQFALPWRDGSIAFSKDFLGSRALLASTWRHYTLAFAGFDPRKVPAGPESSVFTGEGRRCGRILTCTTDMAIDRDGAEIVRYAPGRVVRGLSCGFVLVDQPFAAGSRIVLGAGKRQIEVEVRTEVRPARTARLPLALSGDGNNTTGRGGA